MKRILEETNLNLEELIDKCSKDDILNIILSGRISKVSSRQGSTDEYNQLKVCNDISELFGINIIRLNNNEYRPLKGSEEIIQKNEMKKRKILKDNCLKSFDSKITGNMKGWIFSKVVKGKGGHQDNVFEEADILCKWVEEFNKNKEEIYVIMIDTDLINKINILKTKYKHVNNILITDHYEFQNYIINNYKLI